MKRYSSWISSILYRDGFLAIFLDPDYWPNHGGLLTPVAMLYSDVPEFIPGLLSAGTGRRSVGLAYNRLVKGKYPYQRVEGADRVRELKRLMTEVGRIKCA